MLSAPSKRPPSLGEQGPTPFPCPSSPTAASLSRKKIEKRLSRHFTPVPSRPHAYLIQRPPTSVAARQRSRGHLCHFRRLSFSRGPPVMAHGPREGRRRAISKHHIATTLNYRTRLRCFATPLRLSAQDSNRLAVASPRAST